MDLKVTRYGVRENGVATIWLSRPGRGNSWTNRMNAEYRWIVQELESDPAVRVIVVTGEGRQFCVGADTKALDFYADSEVVDYAGTVNRPELATPGYGLRPEFDHDLVWHWGLRLPVIAAVNGACAGIAMALASFCDLRYAASGAKFTTAAPRLGLPAEYGLSWVLPRLMGVSAAADVLLTGRVISAEELRRYGFLNDVFPSGDGFIDQVYQVADSIAEGVSPVALTTAKRQMYTDLLRVDVGASVDQSKELIGVLMGTPDFGEGVKALADRRPPQFADIDPQWLARELSEKTFRGKESE